MRIKTIVIILITILLTIVLVQNSSVVSFKFLWATFWMSKLIMLLFVGAIFFVLGVLVGRPKRVKKLGGDFDPTISSQNNSSTLSEEDRDYIN